MAASHSNACRSSGMGDRLRGRLPLAARHARPPAFPPYVGRLPVSCRDAATSRPNGSSPLMLRLARSIVDAIRCGAVWAGRWRMRLERRFSLVQGSPGSVPDAAQAGGAGRSEPRSSSPSPRGGPTSGSDPAGVGGQATATIVLDYASEALALALGWRASTRPTPSPPGRDPSQGRPRGARGGPGRARRRGGAPRRTVLEGLTDPIDPADEAERRRLGGREPTQSPLPASPARPARPRSAGRYPGQGRRRHRRLGGPGRPAVPRLRPGRRDRGRPGPQHDPARRAPRSSCGRTHRSRQTLTCDVADTTALRELLAKWQAAHGAVDVLVNNVAQDPGVRLVDIAEDDYRTHLRRQLLRTDRRHAGGHALDGRTWPRHRDQRLVRRGRLPSPGPGAYRRRRRPSRRSASRVLPPRPQGGAASTSSTRPSWPPSWARGTRAGAAQAAAPDPAQRADGIAPDPGAGRWPSLEISVSGLIDVAMVFRC